MTTVSVTACAALEQLADQLGSRSYATILTGGPMPTLRVVNRHGYGRAEDIHVGDGWYCGASAGLIAPRGNPPAAAAVVARVLGGRVSR